MELVIASNNKNKIREIREIVGDYFDRLYSLSDLKINIEIEETGTTFTQNAMIKAKAISELTNMVAIADDSGLVVDALNGAPGVYSARYAKTGVDSDNNALLLKNMEGETNRKARFVSSIVLYYPDGKYIVADGSVEGEILDKEYGEKGFGYDPLFFCTEIGQCFGLADSEVKNGVSHRGKALRELKSKLQKK